MTPCPCGSGKKYKKCCLNFETKRDMSIPVRWITENTYLHKYLDPLIIKYFPEKFIDNEINLSLLLDAFIFDYKIPLINKSPFEYFLDEAEISEDDKVYYEKLLDNIAFCFEVLKIDLNEGIELYDLLNKKTYYVKEKIGTHNAEIGNMLTGRIVKIGNFYELISPASFTFSGEVVYSLKRLVKGSKDNKEICMFDILNIILLKDKEPEKLDDIIKSLKNKIKDLKIKINLDDLEVRINSNKTPDKAFPEIFNFNFSSNEDFEEMISIINNLWNNYPRNEFGGKTPSEKSKYGPQGDDLIKNTFYRSYE